MARKRPSLTDIANMVGEIRRADEQPAEAGDAPDEEEGRSPPEAYWRKATVPYRQSQLAELEMHLGQWALEKKVKVSTAEVLRLALDRLLDAMAEAPDEVILALYRQEQREQAEVETRKYSRSRGAERYLRRRKLI